MILYLQNMSRLLYQYHQFEYSQIHRENSFLNYDDTIQEISNSYINLLIIGQDHGPMIPAKLFDYFIVGRPIFCLGPENSEVKQLINRFNNGIYVNINSSREIEICLLSLIEQYHKQPIYQRLNPPEDLNIKLQINKLAHLINCKL